MLTEFGTWLQGHMDEHDWNLSGIAAKIGIRHSSVRKWMHGQSKPSPKNARKLAQVLRVPVAEVYAALGLVPRDGELPESKQEIIDLLAQAPEDAQTYRAIRSLLTSLLDDVAQ